MRSMKALLLVGAMAVATFAPASSQAADCPGNDTYPTKTAAGSSKDDCGGVHCGTKGVLPTGNPGGIRTYINQTSDGAEFEACNDSGPGNTQGRLVLQLSANAAHPGMRLVLDTDDGQGAQFDPGYIVVQVSSLKPGVWCNNEGKAGEPGTKEGIPTSDGYYHQWNNPGTQGGSPATTQYCLPLIG